MPPYPVERLRIRSRLSRPSVYRNRERLRNMDPVLSLQSGGKSKLAGVDCAPPSGLRPATSRMSPWQSSGGPLSSDASESRRRRLPRRHLPRSVRIALHLELHSEPFKPSKAAALQSSQERAHQALIRRSSSSCRTM